MEDGECYCCGLYLDDTPVCPGCCAVQYPAGAVVNAPRCAGHADRLAAFRCSSCGAYGCAQCQLDEGCYACLPTLSAALSEELGRVRRRMRVGSFCFAVAAPAVALSAHQTPVAAVLLLLSGCILSLSLDAWRQRDFSAVALGLTFVASLVLIWLIQHTALALGPLATAASLFVQMNHSSWLRGRQFRAARLLR